MALVLRVGRREYWIGVGKGLMRAWHIDVGCARVVSKERAYGVWLEVYL